MGVSYTQTRSAARARIAQDDFAVQISDLGADDRDLVPSWEAQNAIDVDWENAYGDAYLKWKERQEFYADALLDAWRE